MHRDSFGRLVLEHLSNIEVVLTHKSLRNHVRQCYAFFWQRVRARLMHLVRLPQCVHSFYF